MKKDILMLLGALAITAYGAVMPKALPLINSALLKRSARIPLTQHDLERTLTEEKQNMNVEEDIEISFVPNLALVTRSAAIALPVEKGYHIKIDPRFGNSRYALRHELCHIKNDKTSGYRFTYLYWYEPKAILCALVHGGLQ